MLNADDLAKRIMVDDPEVREEIRQTFGPESYRADGSLNREFLAEEAFERGRVKELNAIVHPRIPARSMQIMDQARREGHEVFVYEAALLLQNMESRPFDAIVLVLADKEKRLERVKERDNADEEEILGRMEKQQDFRELTHLADHVIENNGTPQELEQKAKELYKTFLEMDKNLD